MEYRYMEFSFDDGRVRRSREIAVISVDSDGHQMPEHHYMAFGGSPKLHYCHTKPFLSCDCPDFEWGDHRLCKHLIAALASEEDELMMAVLGNENNDPLGPRGQQE